MSDTGVGIKALEGVHINVVHDRMERIGEVHRVVRDLGAGGVSALDVEAKRQATGQSLVQTVNLAAKRTEVGLNGTTGGHEVLKHRTASGLAEVLVVAIAAKLRVLGHQHVLPWQHDLVVVGEPTGIEVRAPVVDFILGVAHAEDGQILLDGRGTW